MDTNVPILHVPKALYIINQGIVIQNCKKLQKHEKSLLEFKFILV
jgi:hypothetical protein